ncbi:MAG: peptide chain release factor 2 [Spirochaetota bacterium]|nr:peptide chain release factor 2 [Spirochaetota bacterium]HPV97440.1 peptide chain release factor 2 [Spirochaetota bacterium]
MEEREYREAQRELNELAVKTDELYASVNVAALKERLKELEQKACSEDIWKDMEQGAAVNQEISRLKKKIEPWDKLKSSIAEARDLMAMALGESDRDVLDEVVTNIPRLSSRFDELETLELLSGEDDQKNAFITIHPGAGGTESQDWASMLFRMYVRWAENNDYELEVIDYTPGEEAGIKSGTALVKGDYAYGLLKCERGIHRLVRISPFDSNRRRHTSFASMEVVPELAEDIDLGIADSELRIDTYRASGAGGQHVNRTDSAVRITHLPTGIVVQCQNERSQHKNKASAMKVLRSKLYELRHKEMEEKKLEKIGEKKDISWGNQIRSYVFQPYTLVKDHRTGEEMGSIENVMEGDINAFIYRYLKTIRRNV